MALRNTLHLWDLSNQPRQRQTTQTDLLFWQGTEEPGKGSISLIIVAIKRTAELKPIVVTVISSPCHYHVTHVRRSRSYAVRPHMLFAGIPKSSGPPCKRCWAFTINIPAIKAGQRGWVGIAVPTSIVGMKHFSGRSDTMWCPQQRQMLLSWRFGSYFQVPGEYGTER